LKTVKVVEEHHKFLKVQSAEAGVSLQAYLAFILEAACTSDPLVKEARDAFFHSIDTRRADLLAKAIALAQRDTD
jgi:hypothetical protein